MTVLAADTVALTLTHVTTCGCRYTVVKGEDVKLIDACCISAYVVPDAEDRS